MSSRKTYEPDFYYGQSVKTINNNHVVFGTVSQIFMTHNQDNIVTFKYEIVTSKGIAIEAYKDTICKIDEMFLIND